jgi:hypothetical protein
MERKDDGAIGGRGLAARAAGATALVLGAGVWAARSAAAAAPGRGYTAASFALTLDGSPAGLLRSVEGGGASAEVIEEKASGNPVKKHLGTVRYDDVVARVGLGVGKALQGWIAETLEGKPSRRSGTIQTIDAAGTVRSVREFTHALISEIGFPALDAGSKDTAALTVAWTPESTRAVKAGGKAAKAEVGPKQKQWLVSNFRFTLGDLPTDRVSKIDAFTIRQTAATDPVGEIREYRKEPGVLEIPNLRVTFAEVDLPKWETWFQDFVIKGESGDEQELTGRIAFLNPSLAKEIGSIELEHVGICRLAPEPATAGAETVRRWTAELYVERMTVSLA